MNGTIIIYKAKGKSSSSQLSRALNGYKDYSNKGKYLYYYQRHVIMNAERVQCSVLKRERVR